ncbi:MAG: dethiobiotin synthase [Polyangiaceae bacterium]
MILGAGTGVGKTRVSVALLRALTDRGHATLGLKPVESGVLGTANNPPGSDAASLADAASHRTTLRSPLYALRDPVSPHLAARNQGLGIKLASIQNWVREAETAVTPLVSSDSAFWSVIETAGGVFSPLADRATNFELGLALDPAIWILVAADALGVLHDLSATLQAMRARSRGPDHVVLSAAREPDASTGCNNAELDTLGIASTSAVLARNDDRGIASLVERLLNTPAFVER